MGNGKMINFMEWEHLLKRRKTLLLLDGLSKGKNMD